VRIRNVTIGSFNQADAGHCEEPEATKQSRAEEPDRDEIASLRSQ
jgi:hypothetical protein